MSSTPPRARTPAVQRELDALVYARTGTPAAAPAPTPTKAAPSAYMVQQLGEKHVPLIAQRAFSGRDTADHFTNGVEMTMSEGADGSTPFDVVYNQDHVNKDTEDHFGSGMNMAEENDTSMAFDRVYDSRFTHKDTEDHFKGMIMAGDEHSLAEDARNDASLKSYHEAKARFEANLIEPEQLHMGNEQKDNQDHFGTGMNFHPGYLDGEEPEGGEGDVSDPVMRPAGMPDPLNTFERVFGQDPHATTKFPPGTFSMSPPGLQIPMDMRYYPVLSKKDMRPPARPKFLHGVQHKPYGKTYTTAMQVHLDSLVVMGSDGKAVGGGAQSARAPAIAPMMPGSEARAPPTVTFAGGGSGGGGGGAISGGEAAASPADSPAAPPSRFAWNSERIAHELVCKFDQFTRRREDHMRKLLWTFGSDPHFESSNKVCASSVLRTLRYSWTTRPHPPRPSRARGSSARAHTSGLLLPPRLPPRV